MILQTLTPGPFTASRCPAPSGRAPTASSSSRTRRSTRRCTAWRRADGWRPSGASPRRGSARSSTASPAPGERQLAREAELLAELRRRPSSASSSPPGERELSDARGSPGAPFRLDRALARGRAHASVDEELAFHLEEAEEELVAGGMVARRKRAREALRRFGDLEGTRAYCATCRHADGTGGEESHVDRRLLASDVRYALEVDPEVPRDTRALVVATLAFGVAANTTIFSAMRPYLLRPLPYGAAGRARPGEPGEPGHRLGHGPLLLAAGRGLEGAQRTPSAALGAYSYGAGNLTGDRGARAGPVRPRHREPLRRRARGGARPGPRLPPRGGPPGRRPVVLLSEASGAGATARDPGDPRPRRSRWTACSARSWASCRRGFIFPFGSARALAADPGGPAWPTAAA